MQIDEELLKKIRERAHTADASADLQDMSDTVLGAMVSTVISELAARTGLTELQHRKLERMATEDSFVAEVDKALYSVTARAEKWEATARFHSEKVDELEVKCNSLGAEAHRAHRRADISEQGARATEMGLRVDLEVARTLLSQLEEALNPTLLISYAMNHPKPIRQDGNALRWPWEALDKVSALFATKGAFLSRLTAGQLNYHQAVEQEVRAWWVDAMGNLPGPALPSLLERLSKLLTPTSAPVKP